MIAKLNRILEKLRPHTLMSDLPYEVHYVDHKTVNAVCYPAGHILFFKGIFDPKQGLIDPNNEDEIAAVMGHEIAHATLRHSYRTHRKAQTTSILGNIASIFVGSAGSAASQIFSAVFDVTTGLYFPSHSRKQEAASDLEGVYTMMGAGYDPASAVTLWERAAQRKGGGKTSFFATHPSSRHRAKLLQAHIDNIRAQK
jgi:metalloendopeptidase OMA1, mitochondrial